MVLTFCAYSPLFAFNRQVVMDRERGERMSMESQLRDRSREIAELQARYDAHSAELNAR